jgi:hypothetical protein
MIPKAMLAVAYATDRVSHARQVKGDDPDKKGYPGPPGWVLGVRPTNPPHKKIMLQNLKRRPRPTQCSRVDDHHQGCTFSKTPIFIHINLQYFIILLITYPPVPPSSHAIIEPYIAVSVVGVYRTLIKNQEIQRGSSHNFS